VFQTAAAFVVTVLKPARVEHDSAQADCTGTQSHQGAT
jgi:hypothetical protein